MRFAYLSLDLGNSFNEILAQNLEAGLSAAGHSLLVVEGSRLSPSDPAAKPKNHLYDLLPLDSLDGIIVSSLFGFVGPVAAREFMERFRGMRTLVLTDSVDGHPSITVDNAPGFRALVSHLADDCGCRRFAIITGPEAHKDSIQRKETLEACLAERGMSVDPRLVFHGTYDFFDGVDGVSAFMDSAGPAFDALVCFNDNMALGALRELGRRGVDVPTDVRVTGFDDVLESRFVSPALTTVTYPLDELGRAAVDYVLGMIGGKDLPHTVSIPSRFIPRASTLGNEAAPEVQTAPASSTESGAALRPATPWLPHEWLYSRKTSEILADIGEEIGTAFDEDRIARRLLFHLPRIGLEGCILALYTEASRQRVRIVIGPEGRSLPGDFPAGLPAPGDAPREWGGLVACCLHVRDEQLGYIIFPFKRSSGLTYKILAGHVSIAFSGVRLVDKIDSHSRELETKVQERTAELKASTERLNAEIEERNRIESLLLRQKNYESLGQLAGGIAHDFNNYLAGILGNVFLLKDEGMKPEERLSCLTDLESIARKATGLTRQLLTFSRGGTPVKKAVDVQPLVEEAVRFLLRGTAVSLRFETAGDLPESEVDVEQLTQVLHNLVINAVQAMEGKGELSIYMGRKTLGSRDGRLEAGDYLIIRISDSGCGMTNETLERIFDPYFSTKENGTGLGLSVSLSVIQRHGGDIRVRSAPGAGTTFTIYLPAMADATGKTRAAAMAADKAAHDGPKGLRILVLEDEEVVGRALERLLRALGHEPIMSRDGRETIDAFVKALSGGNRFDLVIADLTIIGGMGGLEAMEGILKADPTVKSIVVSGYSDVGVMADPTRYGFSAGMQKPYGLDDLRAAIASVFPA